MQQKLIVRLHSVGSGQFAAVLGSLAYIFGVEFVLEKPAFSEQAEPPSASFALFSGMIAISPAKELLRCNMTHAFMSP